MKAWRLHFVWAVVSVEDQKTADERIPYLLTTPAAVRGISYEPALAPVDLTEPLALWAIDELRRRILEDKPSHPRDGKIDWVICGGESGRGARPMHPDWARSVRDQCVGAGVPFFFKQWGAWAPHHPVAGGDLGGDVHSGRVTIVHPTGQSDIEVFAASGRNTVPGSRFMERLGKKASGRMLDGVEWSMWPEVVVGE